MLFEKSFFQFDVFPSIEIKNNDTPNLGDITVTLDESFFKDNTNSAM